MDIYYYSGTGNTLFAARELSKRLPGVNLIPIVGLLNQSVIKPEAATVGFMFPVYFMTVPAVVKNFIKRLDLTKVEYLFAVATRGGTPTRAFIDIDNVLKKKGGYLDASFILNMAYNDPKFHYETPTNKEITRLEADVRKRLGAISKVILKKEYSRETDTTIVTFISPVTLILIPVLTGISEATKAQNSYYTDEKCTGCGTCEHVCLSGKIRLADNKPVWQKSIRCFNCEACINYCPQAAIQIKDSPFLKFNTRTNGRYTHPYATVEEIAAQKTNRG